MSFLVNFIVLSGLIFSLLFIHELGHLITAKYYGYKADLELFSVLVSNEKIESESVWEEHNFWISFNGVVSGFVFWFLVNNMFLGLGLVLLSASWSLILVYYVTGCFSDFKNMSEYLLGDKK